MRKENVKNRVKGAVLVLLGIWSIVFVYHFDASLGRVTVFGTKAIICFAFGILTVVNGIRIFRRKI